MVEFLHTNACLRVGQVIPPVPQPDTVVPAMMIPQSTDSTLPPVQLHCPNCATHSPQPAPADSPLEGEVSGPDTNRGTSDSVVRRRMGSIEFIVQLIVTLLLCILTSVSCMDVNTSRAQSDGWLPSNLRNSLDAASFGAMLTLIFVQTILLCVLYKVLRILFQGHCTAQNHAVIIQPTHRLN